MDKESRQPGASDGVSERELARSGTVDNSMFHVKQLDEYKQLLLKWQQKINLISPNTINDIDTRHIQDSLQLKKFITSETKSIIDIGSGAGLPGIPLTIATGIKTFLIESDLRKTLFLDEVIRQLKLNATTVNKRIEEAMISSIDTPVVITSRALSSLENIFELVNSFLVKNNLHAYKLLLLKGKNVSRETLEAEKHWEFSAKYEKSETDEQASIVIIERFARKT